MKKNLSKLLLLVLMVSCSREQELSEEEYLGEISGNREIAYMGESQDTETGVRRIIIKKVSNFSSEEISVFEIEDLLSFYCGILGKNKNIEFNPVRYLTDKGIPKVYLCLIENEDYLFYPFMDYDDAFSFEVVIEMDSFEFKYPRIFDQSMFQRKSYTHELIDQGGHILGKEINSRVKEKLKSHNKALERNSEPLRSQNPSV